MRIEPFLEWPRRLRSTRPPPPSPEADEPMMSLPELAPPPSRDGPDPRRMSPRQIAEWAHELYLSGAMAWEDYRLVGFPSELHPSFDETIGALTGERAEPDRPRDMIAEWERRHAFERRYYGRDSATARRSARILELLRGPEITAAPAAPARRG